ncbi:unnamed protein product [Blepharisma stoltei]|uniref:Uncharacterized protein n=1 Tax=Blepharisma stoltei TaxID=1481888 RepID=A0AAU9ISU5_9CILI|nr:unnamed protein product [Blepharisma stoltei]
MPTVPRPMRFQVQLSPTRCNGKKHQFLRIAIVHNPTKRSNMRYTTCCSQPIHQNCCRSSIVSCPHCRFEVFALQDEPFDPTRAFSH